MKPIFDIMICLTHIVHVLQLVYAQMLHQSHVYRDALRIFSTRSLMHIILIMCILQTTAIVAIMTSNTIHAIRTRMAIRAIIAVRACPITSASSRAQIGG
jgi:hypothetical protein